MMRSSKTTSATRFSGATIPPAPPTRKANLAGWWTSTWPEESHTSLVAGPPKATLDPETGLFKWNTPLEPQTAKVTIRARDAEKPELTAEGSFTVTTTPKH